MSQPELAILYRSHIGQYDDWGIEHYKVPHFYEDPRRSIDSLKKKPVIKHEEKLHFKRQTYIDDVQKTAKQLPGPSQYSSPLVPVELVSYKKRSKSLPKLKQGEGLGRKDSISELIKLKMSIPGIGKYNIVQSLEEQQKKIEKYSHKPFKETEPRIIMTKYSQQLNVGPGLYNNHDKQFGKEATKIKISPEHKTKPINPSIILPSVHTYNPLPPYHNFEKSLQLSESREKKGSFTKFSKAERCVNPEAKHVSPSPASYTLQTKWVEEPAKQLSPNKQRNIFKSMSKLTSKSIYYE